MRNVAQAYWLQHIGRQRDGVCAAWPCDMEEAPSAGRVLVRCSLLLAVQAIVLTLCSMRVHAHAVIWSRVCQNVQSYHKGVGVRVQTVKVRTVVPAGQVPVHRFNRGTHAPGCDSQNTRLLVCMQDDGQLGEVIAMTISKGWDASHALES